MKKIEVSRKVALELPEDQVFEIFPEWVHELEKSDQWEELSGGLNRGYIAVTSAEAGFTEVDGVLYAVTWTHAIGHAGGVHLKRVWRATGKGYTNYPIIYSVLSEAFVDNLCAYIDMCDDKDSAELAKKIYEANDLINSTSTMADYCRYMTDGDVYAMWEYLMPGICSEQGFDFVTAHILHETVWTSFADMCKAVKHPADYILALNFHPVEDDEKLDAEALDMYMAWLSKGHLKPKTWEQLSEWCEWYKECKAIHEEMLPPGCTEDLGAEEGEEECGLPFGDEEDDFDLEGLGWPEHPY